MQRTVTTRHIVLAVSAIAVLAMGVYLFNEVRATPTPDPVPQRTAAQPPAPKADEPEDKPPEPTKVASRPAANPVRETQPIRTAPPPPAASDTPPPSVDSVTAELDKPNPKLDAVMGEANKAYDHGDFDDAKGIALKVLQKDPANVRMLRIVVSANCIDGDFAEAQKHYLSLPQGDREQMKVRCARYGVTFNDK